MMLKRTLRDKYSVAWFKLAECVSRREKERALGVYRLLSHSFDNPALARQLEGDILLAFDDTEGAKMLYEKAAELYEAQAQLMQAIAVYDNLFTLASNQEYLEKIISLYAQLKQPVQVLMYVRHLCLVVLRKEGYDLVVQLLNRFRMEGAQRTEFVSELACAAVADPMMPSVGKRRAMQESLILVMHDVQLLSKFFSKLKAIDPYYYQEACAYVESA